MSLVLDERYQTEIYEAVRKGIREKGKACIIMPPGTGKTIEALKLIEDNPDKNVIYLTPSPKINSYIRKQIRVIYDEEVAKKILSRITFKTYHGLMKEYKTHPIDLKNKAKIIIEDELHRTGAPEWEKAVDYLEEKNADAIILGMTATPVRTDGRNMAEERFQGIDYEFKLTEAIARGVLKKFPIYVCARYIFEEDIARLEKRIGSIDDETKRKEYEQKWETAKRKITEAGIGVSDILNKYMQEKNGKWLVFCNPGEDIEKLQEEAIKKGWFAKVNPNYQLLNVESYQSERENVEALRKFEKPKGADLRIMYSKNMLNEGIHDNEITGELMLRPTKSYILFLQQLGRILSKGRFDTPIVLDLVGNIQYFEQFRHEIIELINQHKGDSHYLPSAKEIERFQIIEETMDFVQAFEEVERNLEEYLNKSSISTLLDMLEIMQAQGIDLANMPLSRRERKWAEVFKIKRDKWNSTTSGKI